MPSNLLKLSSSSIESELHNRSDFERSGSFDSQGSHRSRSRSSNMDDENLKYLTNEEKNVLMFFEETLDAFEDEPEEPPVSLNSSSGHYSPRSTEESHSDSEDIIDLVQTGHNHKGVLSDNGSRLLSNGQKHAQHDSRLLAVPGSASVPVTIPASTIQREEDYLSSEPPIDYPKFLGAIPTPLVIAQNISEKKAENTQLSTSPKDEKSPDLKKSVATSPIGDDHFVFPAPSNGKLSRFPQNISVKLSGKQYNKTIAKAAVNVQERKAQVLANLHGPALFAEEMDGKSGDSIIRRTSFRDVASEQTRYEALTKLGLVKETPVQADMQTTSACTSPVSNGQHSQMLFPPEMKRRLSHEKVNTNTQHSPKTLESNTKISNEHHAIINQNSSKYFTTETKKVPSIEKENMGGQHPPKIFVGELNRRLSHEKISTNVQHSPMIPSPESNKRVSNEHAVSNGQSSSKFFTTETKKVPSIEKDNMSGHHQPKVFVGESNRRLSHEKISTNVQHSPKVVPPESNKRVSNEHAVSNGQSSSKFFTTETKKVPSTEQDNMGGQHPPKFLAGESNRRLSHEKLSTNVQHSLKVPTPESNTRVSNEHAVSNGTSASKFFSTETKKVPSTEQDNGSALLLPKVSAEGPYRRLSSEQESISRILRSEPSAFIPLGKTVVIKGDTAASSLDTSKRHSSVRVNPEQKQPNNHQDIKRTYTVPRPTGFRSQGITVQFSGRDASEESRKDALRKLGLLKGQSEQ